MRYLRDLSFSCSCRLVLTALVACGLQNAGFAADSNADPSNDASWRFTQFQWENDDIFPHPNPGPGDRFYTNGLRFTWGKVFGSEIEGRYADLPAWTKFSNRLLCPGSDCYVSATAGIGQNFYTPEVITVVFPQPGDRPWAGWLYAHFATTASRIEESRHRIELQVGVTGEGSFARTVQIAWHDLIDAPTPAGWRNQFKTEVGVNLFYDYQYRFDATSDNGFGVDAIPMFTAAAGTNMTHAGVGTMFRLGQNISGFAYRTIPAVKLAALPGLDTAEVKERLSPKDKRPTWEYYLFAGGHIRAIAHNYFLEGSVWRDEPAAVKAEKSVWEIQYGFSIRKDNWRATYSINRRAAEFVRTVGLDRGVHEFVSFSITREFE